MAPSAGDAARDLYLEVIALAERDQDDSQLGEALFGLAYTYVWLHRIDDAELMADRALLIANEHNDELRITHLLAVRGTYQWMREDLASAMKTYADVTRRARAIGDVGIELSSERVLAGGLVRIAR